MKFEKLMLSRQRFATFWLVNLYGLGSESETFSEKEFIDSSEPVKGLQFDSSDRVKDCEQWTYKGLCTPRSEPVKDCGIEDSVPIKECGMKYCEQWFGLYVRWTSKEDCWRSEISLKDFETQWSQNENWRVWWTIADLPQVDQMFWLNIRIRLTIF